MKNKIKTFITAGVIAGALAIGAIIYNLEDIKQEIRYRNLWKNHEL